MSSRKEVVCMIEVTATPLSYLLMRLNHHLGNSSGGQSLGAQIMMMRI